MPDELMVRQTEVGIFISPDIVLQNAMTAAKALADVISKKKKPVIMNGEQYLEYEDWQLCGQFYRYTVKTGDAVPVEIDGVKGAKAHADLIDLQTGQIMGGAEAYCMRDEEHWNTRPKYEWEDPGEGKPAIKVKVADEVVPWFQLASQAQTRAGAKAFRNRLAWVVVLAGYRPTPAEELTGQESTQGQGQVQAAHFCKEHNTPFFKKGKMKAYAHPIGDSGVWCHEHTEDKAPPENKPTPSGTSEAKGQAVTSSEGPTSPGNGNPPTEIIDKAPDLTTLEFKNAGEFYTAVFKYFPQLKTQDQVNKEISMFDLSIPAQRKAAWLQLVATYGKT